QINYTKTQMAGLKAQIGTQETDNTAVKSNLPRLTSFFGRQKELATIAQALLPETRSWGVLIDGPGGIGKTSLAIRSAELVPAAHFDQIIFLSAKVRELTPSGEQPLEDYHFGNFIALLTELAHELGDDQIGKLEESKRPRTILRTLAGTDTLLIIDNLETFVEEERVRLYQFLARMPDGCKAIVTSRRRTDIDVRIIRLDRLLPEDAQDYIEELAQNNRYLQKASEAERDELYTITNGNPLLIHWLVGQLGRAKSQCRTIADACAFIEKAPKGNDPLDYIFGDLLDTFTKSEEQVLTALVHFKHPAELKWIADVAGIAETMALTACEDLTDRALLVADSQLSRFFLPPLATTFLRHKRPDAVIYTANRLADSVFALVLENGLEEYERFPALEAEWETVAAALPLFEQGENERLQHVCSALTNFLNFSGRWDTRLTLNEKAEAKAITAGDFYNAGWRAYTLGEVHYLREEAADVFTSAQRCADHWEQASQAGAREQAIAINLEGMGHELEENYPAAVAAYEKTVALSKRISPESDDIANGLNSLANVEHLHKEYVAAEGHYREALRIVKKINQPEAVATCIGNLAELALDQEKWAEGERLAREALLLSENIRRQALIGHHCWCLAKALAKQGKMTEGLPYAQRAVEIFTFLRMQKNLEEAQEALKECGG
ncbi:MAG: tetratricopeptide (TPR) repeat protein, partial [Candidatus Promineifilaceae bacterium]